MSVAAFGVRKPVVANLVMWALIAAGVVFGLDLRLEFFPEVRPNQVLITAPYPGAAPEEVERTLAIKIEDAIEDLNEIEEVITVAAEGVVTVRIEFEEGVDFTEKLFEVKREVDALQDLPEESERITVSKFEPNLPVCVLSVFGEADERSLKDSIRRMRDDLRTLPGMGDIVISGTRTDEITVEVEPGKLLEHGLSLPVVADAVRAAMIELPGGAVRSGTQNVAVRTMGAEERAEEIRRIVVEAGGAGQIVRIRDIARVTPGFEDIDIRSRLNGRPSASLTVYKTGEDDAVEMAGMVKAYAAGRRGERIEPTLGERVRMNLAGPDAGPVSPRLQAYELGLSRPPAPGEVAITTDLSRFVVGRLELLSRNAAAGGVLVLLTLVVLLNFRVAFWTAVGLSVSLLATLATMYFTGYTLNMLTMFGLIIVIGLLVDDAIVVAENITARHERGEPADQAAVRGTDQVTWPVISTVLTTICAFMPLTLIEGFTGDLLGVLPLVVGIALGVSLIECLFILPSHMAHSLHAADRRKGRPTLLSRFEARFDRYRDGLFRTALVPAYLKLLRTALRARYATLCIAIGLLFASFGLVAGGIVQFTFLGSSDAETLNAEVRMPIGTPTAETDRIIRQVERSATAQPEVSAVYASVGQTSSIDGQDTGATASHVGQVVIELVPVEQRDRSAELVKQAIRDGIGAAPGVELLRIEEVSGGPGGPKLNYTVLGDDPAVMTPVAEAIKGMLAEYEGVIDIADDADEGRRELRLTLLDGARELGFTTEWVARQVRAMVFGLEAHTFAGDREDVDVRVTLPEQERRSLAAIERMHLITPDGRPVPMREVVEIEETLGYATIRRLDGRRSIAITADVRPAFNPEEITRELGPRLAELAASTPGVRIVERGRQKDTQESLSTLPIGLLTAAGLIYVILAWLFSSFVQPFVVLSAVPFALIGMIWGHLLLGFDLTILSLIGFIALAGVVVNDSLILMSFYNRERENGVEVFEACVAAGRARLRAIILTTVTTVLGLLPLMLEQSFQARFLIPMAITISFGLISATLIILVVIPCLLMIGRDLRIAGAWLWSGGATGGVDPLADGPTDAFGDVNAGDRGGGGGGSSSRLLDPDER